MRIFIVVAAHRKFDPPKLDDCYHIIKSGSYYEKIDGYICDDEGENLSVYQPILCELSSLYYAYKNRTYDILGLNHYRRYFLDKKTKRILGNEKIEELLNEYDVILPPKKRYYVVTPTQHFIYGLHHNKKTTPLRKKYVNDLKNAIRERFPEYYLDSKRTFSKKSAHLKNMFIMKEPYASEFCNFMFETLLAIKDYKNYKARALGCMGEFLIDVYIRHKRLKTIELPIVCNMDKLPD